MERHRLISSLGQAASRSPDPPLVLPTGHLMPFLEKMHFLWHGAFSFAIKNAKNGKKCPIFVYWAFFQMALCSKISILVIFHWRWGIFFVRRGWQPWSTTTSLDSRKRAGSDPPNSTTRLSYPPFFLAQRTFWSGSFPLLLLSFSHFHSGTKEKKEKLFPLFLWREKHPG